MKALVQRVTSARVQVNGKVVGSINTGLFVLVGVTHHDTREQAAKLARKVYELRIFEHDQSAADLGAEILVVSQFTLYADTRKGRRPSYSAAAPGPVAEPLVEAFVAALRGRGAHVATGVFGAPMEVSLINNGPFTVEVVVENES